MLVNLSDIQSHEVLHKRCDLLIKVVAKIQSYAIDSSEVKTNNMATMFDDSESLEMEEQSITEKVEGGGWDSFFIVELF